MVDFQIFKEDGVELLLEIGQAFSGPGGEIGRGILPEVADELVDPLLLGARDLGERVEKLVEDRNPELSLQWGHQAPPF